MTDFGDKVSDAEKAPINDKIAELKKAVEANNTDEMKAKTEELQKVFYELSSKVYQAAGAQAQPEQGAAQQDEAGKDGFVDADYTDAN